MSIYPSSMSTNAPTAEIERSRHSAVVRVTHWLTSLCFLALLLTGVEILISHPRLYWGDSGNVNTPAWLILPVPSSRDMVPTGYGYVLPDQNGWSRYLHFEAAWVLVSTGAVYVIYGFFKGHFRRNLFLVHSDFSAKRFGAAFARHLRSWRSSEEEVSSYNMLQRLTYLLVIFALFPFVIWTGLAMSPAFESAIPTGVMILGGRQSARTLHFFASLVLTLFLVVHVVMVFRVGFRNRMTAMIIGRLSRTAERG